MKVLYNTCWVDPWLKVARILKENHNMIPTYWIGYFNDGSETLVPEAFPKIEYHSRWDAWKGIFPEKVEKEYVNYHLSVDLLESIARDELQAVSMMDRMDPDRHSFPFSERQRLFRNFLRKWLACIDIYNIEMIISDRLPHRSYDHALYVISKHLGKRFVFLNDTPFLNRTLYSDTIDNFPIEIKQKYTELKSQSHTIDSLAEDISSRLTKAQAAYDKAIPNYMVAHKKNQKKNSNIIKLGFNFIKEFLVKPDKPKINIRRNKGVIDDLLDVHPYAKRKNVSIEQSRYNVVQYGIIAKKSISYKKNLSALYKKYSEAPDYSKKYIYVAMHYQPEATSNPAAGIFVDHTIAIETLLRNTPEDWYIYVKENPWQFDTVNEGQKSRFSDFYTDLLKNHRVKFVPLSENTFNLIDNSVAVATLTGTVGWEAMARKRPVLIFGIAWYEYYDGVLRIQNDADASEILKFITSFSFNENSLISYLRVIELMSRQAYIYMAINHIDQKEEDCINNIFDLLKISEVIK